MIKRGLEAFSPVQVAGLRLTLAGIFLFPWFLKYTVFKPYHHPFIEEHLPKNDDSKVKIVQPKDYFYLLMSGVLGNAIPALLFSFAGQRIPSGLSGILNAFTPMFTLLLGVWLFKDKLTKNGIYGVFIGLAGALFLFGPSLLKGGTKIDPVGACLPLISALLYGYNINIIKHKLSHLPSMVKTAYPFVFVAILYSVILWKTDVAHVWEVNSDLAWNSFGYLFLLGFVGSALSMVIFNYLILHTSALVASTNTFVIPVTAVMWGLLDKEVLTWNIFIGLGFLLTAVYMVMKKEA
jgi:drug/metabolite transporter (DMT)-like permease